MKTYSLLCIFILIPYLAFTQSKLLDSYIQTGLENNHLLYQKKIDLERSLMALRQANALFYPSISLHSQYTLSEGGRSIELPVGDLLNPVYSTLNQLLQNDGKQGSFPQISDQKIYFLPNNYQDTKLDMVLPVINAEIYYNLRIKKEYIGIETAKVQIYKRELVKEIKIAYYHYLQALKVEEAFESAMALVQEALRVNDKLQENHMEEKAKQLRLQAEKSQINAQLTSSKKDIKIATSYFNFLINQPLNNAVIADSVLMENNTRFFSDSIENSSASREELSAIQHAVYASHYALRMNQAYWIPVISNITDWGFQGYQYHFDASQRYVMNVIDLRISLFEGFQNHLKISQAKLEVLQMDDNLAQAEQQIQLELQTAQQNLNSSIESEQAYRQSMNSSGEYYSITYKEYLQGEKSFLDLLDARNQLTKSKVNYILSRFETMIRLAELERVKASYTF